MSNSIPVYKPNLTSLDKEYVVDCMDSSWISSNGKYINLFEDSITSYVGSKRGVAVFNGTVALHLALECMKIGPGDEVLVPTFTYIASINSILTTGATPVLVESRSDDWQMDIKEAEKLITPRTKAIMPVHLYGFACDMVAVKQLANKYNLKVIEDAAEAMGVTVDGIHIGANSDAATFSFFGNKTVTCGEGGIVVTNDDNIADNLAVTKNHGMSATRRYWHDRLGFNYRMTNIQAAIGYAQMSRIKETIIKKRTIYDQYRNGLKDLPITWPETTLNLTSSYWLVSFLVKDQVQRDATMAALKRENIDSRPVFICAHQMPLLNHTNTRSFPISESISSRGLSLPSYPGLTQEDISRICGVIRTALGN